MPGQWITLEAADGSGSFRAYLATPASGGGPGLVLAQEIFGVNGTMRDVADYYAEEGYVVLVPDLFWRQEQAVELDAAKDMPRAFALYQGFDEAKGLQDLQTAISALRARPEVRTQGGNVGVLGFCQGGQRGFCVAPRRQQFALVCTAVGGDENGQLLDNQPALLTPECIDQGRQRRWIALLLARFLCLWGDRILFKWVWATLCREYQKNASHSENQINNYMTLRPI